MLRKKKAGTKHASFVQRLDEASPSHLLVRRAFEQIRRASGKCTMHNPPLSQRAARAYTCKCTIHQTNINFNGSSCRSVPRLPVTSMLPGVERAHIACFLCHRAAQRAATISQDRCVSSTRSLGCAWDPTLPCAEANIRKVSDRSQLILIAKKKKCLEAVRPGTLG